MAYCTQQDLVDRIGEDLLKELTDREGEGEVNETRLAQAIAAASAEVDSYVHKLYPAPLDPVPARIQAVTGDIAIYRLMVAIGYDAASADGTWALLYRGIIDWLKQVAKGEGADIGQDNPAPQGDQPSVLVAPARIFGRDTMQGF